MDSQYGVALTVNGRASFTVAIGPNIALDLQISPSRGAVLVNNYLVEAQQRAHVQTMNAVKNGLNKFTLMGQAARLSALTPITSNAINSINTLNCVYNSLKKRNCIPAPLKRNNINRGKSLTHLFQEFYHCCFLLEDDMTATDRVKSAVFES